MKRRRREPSEQDIPEIPPIPDDLRLPIETLVRLAHMFRGVFMQAAEGKPLEEIWQEQGEYLLLGDRVLQAWFESLHLELDP
ncbi:MAG TPA: hypothetical protein VLH56_15965 [Dissulfurispiraceae bacterium]|nr:hypothetical protein [Dissulfurispiraceae bacterium]